MSQSMALNEYLDEAGFSLEAVFVGQRPDGSLPDYFENCFSDKIIPFFSPYLVGTPNGKGIYVGRTLVVNLLHAIRYIRELRRIRRYINSLQPDVVFNFYDGIGALALRKVDPRIRRVGIGHHFYLHLKEYFGLRGHPADRFLLSWHTRIIQKSCDRVLALSFTEEEGNAAIAVVPPLIRKEFRELDYTPGTSYLAYFLKEGYLYDLILLARDDPEFQADVFTGLNPGIKLPPGIRIHQVEGDQYKKRMASCRGLISTAGFDALAEAAYQGIPLAVIPVRNHFEQACNRADVERSGIGLGLHVLEPGIQYRLKEFDNREFRSWVNRSGELILNAAMK